MYSLKILLVLLLAVSSEASPAMLVEKIVVYKEKRILQLIHHDKILKTYKIALGGNPKGHKNFEGDKKTPEGHYKIITKNPHSQFYKSLRISYPNAKDIQFAKKHGKNPGGELFIHGLGKEFSYLGNAHVQHDWTLGCIAVTNEEIDEIYTNVSANTPIEIYP